MRTAILNKKRRLPRKGLALVGLVATFPLIFACGDNVTTENITQVQGMNIVADSTALPECGEGATGMQVWVRDAGVTYVCAENVWHKVEGVVADGGKCTVEYLADSSGVSIVCAGETVTAEFPKPKSSSSEAVSSSSQEIKELDEEAMPTSLDSLSGFSQKGPFVQGSVVRLYELSDGRTLKQTNGNFMGEIKSSDGFYKFTARDLVSQYALLVTSGYYKNEVTGAMSDEELTLFTLTDVSARSRANINLLTHLEYNRVNHLVVREKMKVRAAKKQARAEILQAFHIDTAGVKNFEDLSVVGNTDGDAALLAISVMLQSNRNIAELTALLSAISKDMEEDGIWDDAGSRRDMAAGVSVILCDLARVRANIEGWNLGEVPEFEKYIENYMDAELGLGTCSEDGKVVDLEDGNILFDGAAYVCENKCWNYRLKDVRTDRYYKIFYTGQNFWMLEDLFLDSAAFTWVEAIDSVGLASDPENPMECGDGQRCVLPIAVQGACPKGWHVPNYDEAGGWIDYLKWAEYSSVIELPDFNETIGEFWVGDFATDCRFSQGYTLPSDVCVGYTTGISSEEDLEKHMKDGVQFGTVLISDDYKDNRKSVRCLMD